MHVETLEDGTVYKRFDAMQGVPTFSDWLKVLLARGAAMEVREKDTRAGSDTFGQFMLRIKPLDRHHEQACILEDGLVKIVCIGCGTPTPKMDMSKIRIGGLIQLAHEEVVSRTEVERKYRIQPVSKSGLGCEACQGLMATAQAEVDKVNAINAQIGTNLAQIARLEALAQAVVLAGGADRCKHGLKEAYCAVCRRDKGLKADQRSDRRSGGPSADKMPSKRTAFIDVFDTL